MPQDVVAKAVNGSITDAITQTEDTWFAAALSAPAVVLLTVGLVVTLEMLIRIECHTSRKVKEIMAGHMRVEASESADGQISGFTLLDIDDDSMTLQVHYSEVH